MKLIKSKTLLVSLCVFFSCLSFEATASQKNKISDVELKRAYASLIKKGRHSSAYVKNKQKQLSHQRQKRHQAIRMAKKQIRKKYRWGGASPRTGFDCSGLTQYAYKSAKVSLPRTANAQYKQTKRISMANLQVGDLIFFRTRQTRTRVNHVGIYLGAGKFIHAPRSGKRVSIAKLNKYWRRKVVGAGRV